MMKSVVNHASITDEQSDEPVSFNIEFQKQGDVARALTAAGFGWLSDNGNRFNTRSSFACQVFENALCERDSEAEQEANARLIAAAPSMLQALKDIAFAASNPSRVATDKESASGYIARIAMEALARAKEGKE